METRYGNSKDYTPELRKQIFNAVKDGRLKKESYTDIAKRLDMSYGVLFSCRNSKWFQELKNANAETKVR